MDTLKRAAEQARAGRGQIVAAMAEAGIRKSRLFSSSRDALSRVGTGASTEKRESISLKSDVGPK
jgi:hypothetical protein